MEDLVARGSATAKKGFANEKEIADKFNNWQNDFEAQAWLSIMNYSLIDIEYVKAVILSGYKADINLQVMIKLREAVDIENLQVKLVSNKKGFNQIDKRWLIKYKEMWNMNEDVFILLKYFTGEEKPYKTAVKDSRRMFLNEFSQDEQEKILNFFNDNKVMILSDIIRGRGEFSAEWVLKNINEVLNYYYGDGVVKMSPRGSINLCRVTVQRKGGDGGRETANMLQFKLDPTELFNI